MSDRLVPLPLGRLAALLATELRESERLLGIPCGLVARPQPDAPWASEAFGHRLATPVGVAAGPHTQTAAGIVAAFLAGARVIELKTIQVLDELDIPRPCIDMRDAGTNVEWSQELRLRESTDEYVGAWVLVHALHAHLGLPGPGPGVLFNASVGYDLAGLRSAPVQAALARLRDISDALAAAIEAVAPHLPAVRGVDIPAAMCTSVTLSTMHGTPPAEIETLALHLLEEQGLDTMVKLNPTLLGPVAVRGTLSELGWADVHVPDGAFAHDPTWDEILPVLERLVARARELGRTFGVKLTNTLEVDNTEGPLPGDEAYLSGRPLHALAVRLADRLDAALGGALDLSISGGVDAFRVAPLLAGGVRTVTVCSDLLKTGGVMRLGQYLDELDAASEAVGARSVVDLIVGTAGRAGRLPHLLGEALGARGPELARRLEGTDVSAARVVAGWAAAQDLEADEVLHAVVRACAADNLSRYAAGLGDDPGLRPVDTTNTKGTRDLGLLDCIAAPCTEACAVDQDAPAYLRQVRDGNLAAAAATVRAANPIGATLARICDRRCQGACVRVHIDEPVAIREVKRTIMEHEPPPTTVALPRREASVGIVGAGPAGLCAARQLVRHGYHVVLYDRSDRPGGTVRATIPTWRLPSSAVEQDLASLEALGIELRMGVRVGTDLTLARLRDDHAAVVLVTGAQQARGLGLAGERSDGVLDAFTWLARVRAGEAVPLGRVGVIGLGDVAVDAARTAWRLGAEVVVLYRRTLHEAPADLEELEGLLDEGVEVRTGLAPAEILQVGGHVVGVRLQPVEPGPRGDDGRRRPVPVEGADLVEVPVDTLLIAVSQSPDLEWADPRLRRTRRKALRIDSVSGATTLSGVFAGGDAADDGPASAVRACGDGKRLAEGVRAYLEEHPTPDLVRRDDARVDRASIEARRARRLPQVTHVRTALDGRRSFTEVAGTLSVAAARQEAERCLECDRYCSICVTVCPNRALFTYTARPRTAHLPTLELTPKGLRAGQGHDLVVTQEPQVAVLADWCNQCGNCAVFCPTAGAPWRDKPRVYLSEEEALREDDHAWLLTRVDGCVALRARHAGETHLLVDTPAGLVYRTARVEVVLDRESLALRRATAQEGAAPGEVISLEHAGFMAVLLEGLQASGQHLIAALAE